MNDFYAKKSITEHDFTYIYEIISNKDDFNVRVNIVLGRTIPINV